jgi:glycopeptide antibiotics resistance protein
MRAVVLGKAFQGTLLAAYTAALIAFTLLVKGGKAVRTNFSPFEDLLFVLRAASRAEFYTWSFMFTMVEIGTNVAMFLVWGFLAFKFLSGKERSHVRSAVDALLAAALLSVGIEAVQLFLPTRAADVNDVFWNSVGAILGVALAAAGRYVALQWE